MNLYKYSTTAANNNSAVPDGFPEGWTGSQVNNSVREFAAAVRTHISDGAYIDETYQLAAVGTKSLTRNSATQIVVSGCDATAHFAADRRIRIVGATTDHGFVTSSSYSAPDTTVNVVMDAADVPTAPTQILSHVDTKIRAAAYYKTGSGNLLDADKLDGYQAADIFGPAIFADALVNGSMLVWQRGTSGSCPINTRTYHADRWWTNPSGAAVTVARSTTTGLFTPYMKSITGAASVTTCEIAGQRIESHLIPYLSTSVTISAYVINTTGASLTLSLLLGTPAAADDFTTVTNRLTQSMTAIGSGAAARITHTVTISSYANLANGLEIKFRAPSGALDSGAKIIFISEIQIDRSPVFSHFRFRPMVEELPRCQRYFRKTFPQATAVAENCGTLAGALHCQMASVEGGDVRGFVHWGFGQPMRATPTVVTFNPTAAAATWDEVGGAGTLTANALNPGDGGVFLYTSDLAGSTSQYAIHATAEAEI